MRTCEVAGERAPAVPLLAAPVPRPGAGGGTVVVGVVGEVPVGVVGEVPSTFSSAAFWRSAELISERLPDGVVMASE